MAEYSYTRRSFITALSLIAGGALLGRYLTPRTRVIRQALVSVAASEVPADGALLFNRERVAVVRTEQGYHAMSLVCTHLGCTVTAAENTFACPCHGSRFDRQGRVLSGPATVALRRLKLEEQQGVLKVYEA